MVKHIVFFRLTSYSSEAEKESQLDKMMNIFSVLPEQIPFITSYTTRKNICKDLNSWDFVIDSLFASNDDLRKYMDSNEHIEAVKKASVIKKDKAVVDYEI